MRHKHHVASLIVVVVESQEVDLAEHGTSADDALAVDKEIVAKNTDKSSCIGDLVPWGNCGVEGCWN
jgi:hypothetical protein